MMISERFDGIDGCLRFTLQITFSLCKYREQNNLDVYIYVYITPTNHINNSDKHRNNNKILTHFFFCAYDFERWKLNKWDRFLDYVIDEKMTENSKTVMNLFYLFIFDELRKSTPVKLKVEWEQFQQ